MNATFVKDISTENTCGGVMNDYIELKNGKAILVYEEGIMLFNSLKEAKEEVGKKIAEIDFAPAEGAEPVCGWNVEGIAKIVFDSMVESEKEGELDLEDDPDIDSYLQDEYHSVESRASKGETELVMEKVKERVQDMIDDHNEKKA